MKKLITTLSLAAFLFLLLLPGVAYALPGKLSDSEYDTYITVKPGEGYELTSDAPFSHVYLEMYEEYDGVTIEANGSEETVLPQLRQVVDLDGAATLALIKTEKPVKICEAALYSEVPPDAQAFEPPGAKIDLLVISAHPDDDMLYMGGTIPYYAGERGKAVMVAYMSHQKRLRQGEALDALWTCRNTVYPLFVGFPDRYSEDIETAAKYWGSEETVGRLVEIYRKYKPDVVVTHDLNGEYGHGAHRLTADSALKAAELASDESYHPASAAQYGAWRIKKLYLHLYPENGVIMDWRVPLEAFGGKTAFDMAEAGYERHVSQHKYSFKVEDTGRYSNAEFGLAYSSVGLDEAGGDFFENVDKPEPSPEPTAQTTPRAAQTPQPSPTGAPKTPRPSQAPAEPSPGGPTAAPTGQDTLLYAIIGVLAAALVALLIIYAIKKARSSHR